MGRKLLVEVEHVGEEWCEDLGGSCEHLMCMGSGQCYCKLFRVNGGPGGPSPLWGRVGYTERSETCKRAEREAGGIFGMGSGGER